MWIFMKVSTLGMVIDVMKQLPLTISTHKMELSILNKRTNF
jgi:hypothetical protein